LELHPGIFKSSVATDDWVADLEVGRGAEEHVLFESPELRAGLTRFLTDPGPEPVEWVLPSDEVLLILDGRAEIEVEDGPRLSLAAGDLARLPKGAVTRWRLETPFTELWVLAG
jgi:quercetin dioxygenase-like cupin family protein